MGSMLPGLVCSCCQFSSTFCAAYCLKTSRGLRTMKATISSSNTSSSDTYCRAFKSGYSERYFSDCIRIRKILTVQSMRGDSRTAPQHPNSEMTRIMPPSTRIPMAYSSGIPPQLRPPKISTRIPSIWHGKADRCKIM